MFTPGNKWVSLWTRAKPKPASQQPSYFDEDEHAEAIIKWFDKMSGYKLFLNILSLVAQKAVERLILDEESAFTREILAENFTKDLCDKLKTLVEQPARDTYLDFLNELHQVEVKASEILSISNILDLDKKKDWSEDKAKYDNLKNVVSKLVSGKEVNLSRLNGVLNVGTLFDEYEKYYDLMNPNNSKQTKKFNSFPPPERKEFVLSVMASRPGPNSKPSPQRMYASVCKDELTMAACFTKDMYYRYR